MRYIIFLILFMTTPLRAEVIDLTKHTSLKGAYLISQPNAEFVTVQLLLNVGEADYDGPEGLAHYLEHLVWYSADKAHKSGAKERISNAWTNTLFTNYWNASDPENLDGMLATSAQVFAPINLAPSFASQERDIVEREFDLGQLDNAGRKLYDQMVKTLLPGHALSRSTIGTRDSIRQITPDMAKAFKDKWYHPKNATLLITGPVVAGDVTPMLKRHLSSLKHSDIPNHPWAKPITWDGRKMSTSITHSKLKEPFFALHIKAPRPTEMTVQESDHSMRMLGALLNSSTKSSPRKALYYDDFILSWIEADVWLDQAGIINLTLRGAPEEDVPLEDAIAATWAFFYDLNRFPQADFEVVAQASIDAQTRQLKYSRFEQNAAFHGLLERGVPYSAAAYLDGLKAVQLTQISTLLTVFQTEGITVTGVAYPEEKQ